MIESLFTTTILLFQGFRKTIPLGNTIDIYVDECDGEEISELPMVEEKAEQLVRLVHLLSVVHILIIKLQDDEELKEMDMEDIMADQPVVDIDVGDIENPLAVVDYVHEIYSFYKESEVKTIAPFLVGN